MKRKTHTFAASGTACALLTGAFIMAASAHSAPVPSYVPPVAYEKVPDYVDDTRGVFVPGHGQHRLLSEQEQQQTARNMAMRLQQTPPGFKDMYAPQNVQSGMSNIVGQLNYASELDRIATAPGLLENPQGANAIEPNAGPAASPAFNQYAQVQQTPTGLAVPQGYPPAMPVAQQTMPAMVPVPVAPMAMQPAMMPATAMPQGGGYLMNGDGGAEMAMKNFSTRTIDMHNSRVSISEDRITIRRALQRMMDQIGAGDWVIVWDLAEQNAALPDMEISIAAQEPFINVLNALLARAQARSGQPLRVVKYDKTQRLVITDRANTTASAGLGGSGSIGVGGAKEAVITENVLKESIVSLHYDEIPLVDALENIIHQAGKGQWRLRVYAGTDQVLKPAHIEEPFGTAVERLLKLFNLKYEVFPGGKLIVVTNNDRFGFSGFKN